MVQVGPQWSQWILKWPQTVPESPRQSFKFQKSSQTVPESPRQSFKFQKSSQVLPFSYQLFISTARCSRRSSVLNPSDKPLLIPGMGVILTDSFECSKWSKWVLNGPNGSSNGPRQSQRLPQKFPDSSKFQENSQRWLF